MTAKEVHCRGGKWWLSLVVIAVGCGGESRSTAGITSFSPTSMTGETFATGASESESESTAGDSEVMSSGEGDPTDPTDPTGSTDPTDSQTTTTDTQATTEDSGAQTTALDPQVCGYTSLTFGQGLQPLDVPKGSPETLAFTITGLPAPEVVVSATLKFDSHDADHPGEEGVITVNGNAAYDLPADAGWDNQDGSGTVEITGDTVAGQNIVRFGAGSLDSGTYYFIGNVQIEVLAAVDDCPEPPPPAPLERTVWYQDASYQMRHNWVLRCNDYAFTAYGDEHLDSDCDDLYDPDGTRRGKAIFAFPELAPATYEVQLRSRHTENRNPLGALFVVDGQSKRINQRDDQGYTTDVWGTKALAGDVEVVLDSSMEGESDSVIWVKLVPVN